MVEFRRMSDLFLHCRTHPEQIVCPVCNNQMSWFFMPTFNMDLSGIAIFNCKNEDCKLFFKVAALNVIV